MAAPYDTAMPANLDLGNGYTLRLTAVDPTTGAVVSGVTVSDLAILVATLEGTPVSGGGFTVTPLLTFTPGVT